MQLLISALVPVLALGPLPLQSLRTAAPNDPRSPAPAAVQPQVGPSSTTATHAGHGSTGAAAPASGTAVPPGAAPAQPTPPVPPPTAVGQTDVRADKLPPLPPKRPARECWTTPGTCRQLSIMGTVFTILGTAAVATGIALVVRDDEVIKDDPLHVRSTHPPGVVLLGIGAGTLITGILMMVAGHRSFRMGMARRESPRMLGLR